MHFSDWFQLGESSSRCEYCGSFVYIFLLHCSSCIFLDVFSFYSLFGCNFSTTLSFFYDFHLRIFMHMRASESYIYSLSFPVRGAWSMHGYLYLSLPAPSCVHLNIPPKTHSFSVSSCPSSTPTLHFSSSFFSPLKTPEENVYQDSSRKCSKLHPHFELSAKAPKIPANGEPRMQFWEHEALLWRSCESHAPRVLREGAAINSPLIVAAL